MINRQYVLLGNTAQWLERSWTDFKNKEGCKIINSAFPCHSRLIGKAVEIHYSNHANKYFDLPFKRLWFPYFIKHICGDKDAELTIIVYDWNRLGNNEDFLKYLRESYPKLTLVYVMTNEVKYSKANQNNFVGKLKKYYDIVYAFHGPDGSKYGFKIIPLVYSWNRISHKKPKHCIFFAGEAKQRFPFLMDIHKRVKKMGLRTKYYVLHADRESRVPEEGITYDHAIPYDEVIRYTQESSCIIEIPQTGLDAFTIKTCEAVFYNKLLITTYKKLKEMDFYDERFMLCIDSADDITPEFLSRWKDVKYSEKARYYFSVNKFMNRLEKDKRKIKENDTKEYVI